MKPKTITLSYCFPSQKTLDMEFEELSHLKDYLAVVVPLFNDYHANLSKSQEPIDEIRIKFTYPTKIDFNLYGD